MSGVFLVVVIEDPKRQTQEADDKAEHRRSSTIWTILYKRKTFKKKEEKLLSWFT